MQDAVVAIDQPDSSILNRLGNRFFHDVVVNFRYRARLGGISRLRLFLVKVVAIEPRIKIRELDAAVALRPQTGQ